MIRSLFNVFIISTALSFSIFHGLVFAADSYSGYSGEEVRFLIKNRWVRAKQDSPEPKKSFVNRFLPTPTWRAMELKANKILQANARLLGLSPHVQIRLNSKVKGDEMETLRYKRFQVVDVADGQVEEVEVRGGDLLVHFQREKLSHVNSNVTAPLVPNAFSAELSKKEALERAKALHTSSAEAIGEPKLMLAVSPEEESRLIYEVKLIDAEDILRSASYYMDASSGSFLYSTSLMQTIKSFSHDQENHARSHVQENPRTRVVMAGSGEDKDFYKLQIGRTGPSDWEEMDVANCWLSPHFSDFGLSTCFPIIYSEIGCDTEILGERITFRSSDPARTPRACSGLEDVAIDRTIRVAASARAAWKNFGIFHDFFSSFFSRRALDNRGGPLLILVQIGEKMNNAFWSSDLNVIALGAGDSFRFKDFATSLDIGAHEAFHGIISHTANLEYVGESGALNESYADIFGKLVSIYAKGFTDWKFGRDVFVSPTGRDLGLNYIRDMKNPSVPHVDKMLFQEQACRRENDNCGVHVNSGVSNRAAVLMLERMNTEDFARVYYLTLTQFLQPWANFQEMRQKTLVACAILLGENASECGIMADSFSQVGIL